MKERPFSIGVYLGDVNVDSGGIGPYAARLKASLQSCVPSHGLKLHFIGKDESNDRLTFPSRILRRFSQSLKVLLKPGAVEQRLSVPNLPRILRGIDLLHVPYQFTPTFEIPFICTMHDVQELLYPENFTPSEREWRAIYHRLAIEKSQRVVCSFDHIRTDIIRYFRCAPSKVVVIPVPYSECKLRAFSQAEEMAFTEKYRKFEKYFLYPAQTWPHKNHIRLIEALEVVASAHVDEASLICTGKLNSNFESIKQRLQASPIQNRIKFCGVVSETELSWLYKNALCVVIPTLYEAGSFPLIEAMASGTAVICSNTTSLPDTIGTRDFVFDATDVLQMSGLMSKILLEPDFRISSIANGQLRIRQLQQISVGPQYFEMWNELKRILHN